MRIGCHSALIYHTRTVNAAGRSPGDAAGDTVTAGSGALHIPRISRGTDTAAAVPAHNACGRGPGGHGQQRAAAVAPAPLLDAGRLRRRLRGALPADRPAALALGAAGAALGERQPAAAAAGVPGGA